MSAAIPGHIATLEVEKPGRLEMGEKSRFAVRLEIG